MKCHLCSGLFEIQTDPKNTEYVVISGAKRKNENWDASDLGIIVSKDEIDEDLKDDPFYKLEKSVTDMNKAKESIPFLSQLYKLNEKQWADPYSVSSRLRKIFREEKKMLKKEKESDEEIRNRNSLGIKLVKKSEKDDFQAKLVDFQPQVDELIEITKKEVYSSPLFTQKANPVSICHNSDKGNIIRQLKLNARMKNDHFITQDSVFTQYRHTKFNPSQQTSINNNNDTSHASQGLVSYESDSG